MSLLPLVRLRVILMRVWSVMHNLISLHGGVLVSWSDDVGLSVFLLLGLEVFLQDRLLLLSCLQQEHRHLLR